LAICGGSAEGGGCEAGGGGRGWPAESGHEAGGRPRGPEPAQTVLGDVDRTP